MPDEPDDEQWAEYRVTPRYLAGSGYTGDPGFEPVAHWPHHSFDDGPCQLLVTSPDHRIKIGWFGDDFDLWHISAAEDPVSPPRWEATFNHAFPPEIVAGLTAALADDWEPDTTRFLAPPPMYWADGVRPLLDAGWKHGAAERGTVEIIAPDQQAGAFIDTRRYGRQDEAVTLWAGPPGWATRAEATFTAGTPAHLIAATAAAMRNPGPVVRERHMLHRGTEHLVQLEPVGVNTRPAPTAPTPLEVKQTAVAAAVQRATHSQERTSRARAARIRTTTARTQPHTATAPTRTYVDTPAHTTARPRR
ncbi:hypothetical protein C3486_00190 [Streptomyces sp. Ru73]|uniref:DUF317 domain-containing protein n=1 Tax=Streptomyces sp. Ru73 TaxID=2080748 RepID=UPI000CDCEA8F|nr:DUF317 domain-containing protein [Streptomyces sp. Ru73]POX43390.1 hypothetical protein C3486_00190 [Streptomyces sp. Ru73]